MRSEQGAIMSVRELPWTTPGWFQQASDWIHAQLTHRNIDINGPIQQPHIRPWSTVLRVPSSAGDLYFKATAPALAHEAALTEALARWRPDCMPQLLAADPDRSWLLMHDGGVPLRSLIPSVAELARGAGDLCRASDRDGRPIR
jgi:hypothetical protein